MRGGGVEINFCLIRGEYDLVLGRISHISQSPSLQVIIALSLSSLAGGSGEGEMKKVYPCMHQGAEILLDSYFAIKKYNILFYQRHIANREFPRTSFMATVLAPKEIC